MSSLFQNRGVVQALCCTYAIYLLAGILFPLLYVVNVSLLGVKGRYLGKKVLQQ